MKKFLLTLITLVFAVYAENPQGIRANVELVSGAKQTAQFLGISQDTVSLGGNIQGKFTIIKIAKNRFKSIIDENGNDLLNAVEEQKAETANDSTLAVNDTAEVGNQTNTVDSTSSVEEAPIQPSYLSTVDSKHIFVALERRSIDSALASQLNTLIMRMLQESGIPVTFAKRSDFGYCRETSCIKDSLAHYGAASAYTGNIIAAKANDSITVQMVHYDLLDTNKKVPQTVQMNLSTMSAVNDAVSKDKLTNFVLQLQGKEKPSPKQKKSYIHVETNPDGATLATSTQGEICRTPCTFVTQDTGKVVLYAYWNVDKQLWGARNAIVPIPFDTTKITLKLKQMRPELRITTTPANADIYAGSAPITIKSKPIGKTPNKYPIFEPGMVTVQLRKEGFRDTSITTFVPPTDLTDLNIDLEPISDIEELRAQEEWIKQRRVLKTGYALMGSAIAPILLGGLFTYIASLNYDDAETIKQELSRPVTSGGEHYKQKIKENHDLVDRGNRNSIIGGTLFGVGAIMLGVGFALTF